MINTILIFLNPGFTINLTRFLLSVAFLNSLLTVFAAFSLFVCFVLTGGSLTIENVYAAFALLNITRLPLSLMPMAYSALFEAIVR